MCRNVKNTKSRNAKKRQKKKKKKFRFKQYSDVHEAPAEKSHNKITLHTHTHTKPLF